MGSAFLPTAYGVFAIQARSTQLAQLLLALGSRPARQRPLARALLDLRRVLLRFRLGGGLGHWRAAHPEARARALAEIQSAR